MYRKIIMPITFLLIFALWGQSLTYAQPGVGEAAPLFALKDTKGNHFELEKMKDRQMAVLYFFDAASQSSMDGLVTLDTISKKYKDADLTVWGITLSSETDVQQFLKNSKPVFPILLDPKSKVSEVYDATMILPTVCILGPSYTIIDYFQGGGKSTEKMLVRLAERKLMQNQPVLAKAISSSAEKINPGNYENTSIRGYAAISEGKLDEAEQIFTTLSKGKGEMRTIGLEGLAAVYVKKGDTNGASQLADELEKNAPERPYANVIKGNVLYSQNKKEEAMAQFQKAVTKKKGASHQKALAYNQLGRVYSKNEQYEKARGFYDQAIKLDPYYVEATSNKGVAYEKEGKWDSALESYKKAKILDTSDVFSKVLAKKASEMIALQKDTENRKRIDKLVKDLADRYRKQKENKKRSDDDWTSRPLIVSFSELSEKGGLTEADGYSLVLTSKLSELLNASGRVQVVERIVMDRLLEELNLGSSDLADQETVLKLGKVLAAKLIGTGSLLHMQKGAFLNLRFIDTETTALAKIITEEIGRGNSLEKDLNKLNRRILKSVIELYPIQGFVIQSEGGTPLLNIGEKQGVVLGTTFQVIEEKEPVMYKGKVLKSAPKVIAEIKVTQVEPDLCYAKVLSKKRELKQDDKVREKVIEN